MSDNAIFLALPTDGGFKGPGNFWSASSRHSAGADSNGGGESAKVPSSMIETSTLRKP
jgi:hypothetical protein